MIRRAVTWLFVGILITLAYLAARVLAPGRRDLLLDGYVLALGAIASLALLASVRRASSPDVESPLDQALDRRPGRAPRLPELERLEREVSFAASTEFDLHFRLRPLVTEILEPRLERNGLRLESTATRELLGEELWDLVRSDREPPVNRNAEGPGLASVRRIVDRLERI
jgi:hypothetical protein